MNDSVRTRVITTLTRPNTSVAWSKFHGPLGNENPLLLDKMKYESEDGLTLTKIFVYRGSEGPGLDTEKARQADLIALYEEENGITSETIVENI